LALLILTTGAAADSALTPIEGLAMTWFGIAALVLLIGFATGLPRKTHKPVETMVTFRATQSFKGDLKMKHIHNGEEIEVSAETKLLLDAIAQLTELEKSRPKGLFEPRFYLDGWKIKRVP
jgi:hypothetical protein